MVLSRRELIACGTAGAITAMTGSAASASREEIEAGRTVQAPDPIQVPSDRKAEQAAGGGVLRGFDMRRYLEPRRLTLAMWDVAYLLRHGEGGSFENYDRVLDEAVERQYNTLRIDPMPQWIDLDKPERILEWPDPHQPYMPWNWNTVVRGPVGRWLIDFIEKLHRRSFLHYTLSGWWFGPGEPTTPSGPPVLRNPANMTEGAEMWAEMLTRWKRRFGFDRLVYVDIANETPYFFPKQGERFKKVTGEDFGSPAKFSDAQIAFLTDEINPALRLLRRGFPELRFTTSIHGDLRWLDVPLELDCLDVHFYADADPRWTGRTRFNDFTQDDLFETDRWFEEFSSRSTQTAKAMAPMLRARERFKMTQFADWSDRRGAPLTTSEAWASWFYIDHPKLD